MAETETITAEIAAVKQWTSGKGYFLNLKDSADDYYKFGAVTVTPGTTVELVVKEGSGNFADKIEVVKIKAMPSTPAQVNEKVQSRDEKLKTYFESTGKEYVDRQKLIVQQTCLKAAVQLVSELYPRTEVFSREKMIELVLTIKDKFYFDIMSGENEMQEPED